MSDHKYEVRMSNGDCAEADTIAGVFTAALTMSQDAGGDSHPTEVSIFGYRTSWAAVAARVHVIEASA